MVGIKDLSALLSNLNPRLDTEEYVFLTYSGCNYGDHAHLQPIASFREKEGLSLVVSRSLAEAHSATYEGVFCRITLQVHSDLEAVGLTAAVANTLAEQGISANVVAAHYHDHVFVPASRADEALQCLASLKKPKSLE